MSGFLNKNFFWVNRYINTEKRLRIKEEKLDHIFRYENK